VTVAPEAMKALRLCPWRGNVRELENVIERAVLLAKNGVIQPGHLPEEVTSETSANRLLSLEESEKQHIRKVLLQTADFEEAASVLGIDRTTLWRKREKYGL
jgi:transcriptional regulator with PAS, ATPase and Fis domain